MLERVKQFFSKYHRPLFYATWLLVLAIQSYNTELFDDEAYYWVYSKFPAWGYFDHPPMIAILIKAGYTIFQNELGVRLLIIILSTASLYIIESLLEKKNAYLFYAICGSLALAQIGGMLAVPDAPLMFFIALFFYIYRLFVKNMSIGNTLLLGLIIALMFYTKYHAVLIVLFTGLSNLKLLRHYQTYLACILAFILFFPHLYWQHVHGYPSVQFHLFERNAADVRLWNTIEFFLGQILLAGPFMGWLLIIAALLYKPVTLTERALKFTFIGIYAFFFVSTFRGHAEANWTIPSFIGMIVLSHQYLMDHRRFRRILYKMLPVTIVVVMIGRIVMMADLAPAWWILKDEFHDNKIFAATVKSKASDYPVVFLDTYQKPSKYWFYSGDTAFGLNTPTYRRNNYNYWPLEVNYIGRPAFVFGSYDKYFFNDGFISRKGEKNGGRLIPEYYSFSRVMMDNITAVAINDSIISVQFTTKLPPEYLALFHRAPYDTASVYLALYRQNKVVRYVPSGIKVKDITSEVQQHIAPFNVNADATGYICKLAITNCLPGRPTLNSAGFTVIKE